MTASAARIARILAGRSRPRIGEACPPEAVTQFFCDGQGHYYTRQCRYNPDCSLTCTSWSPYGS